MKILRSALLSLGLLVALSAPAAAQSGCSAIVNLAILTAAQWNTTCFGSKLDLPTPRNSGGILYFPSTSTVASSAALTANALVVGGGAGGAPASLASIGTTTTVLHGNAAGAPSFSAVSLTTDVAGILPGANGGTGNGFFAISGPASSLKTFAFPNASDTVVTLAATQTIDNKSFSTVTITGITGSTQCLRANSAGLVGGSGGDCGVFSALAGTVTAAATTNLATSGSTIQTVSGNTAITSFGSGQILYRIIRFTGAPVLTNSSTLVSPTGANIQACPGDVATLVSDNSGTPIWTILTYTPFGAVQTAATSSGIGTSASTLSSITIGCGLWSVNATAVEDGGGAPSNDNFIMAISGTSGSYSGTVEGKSKLRVGNSPTGSSSPGGAGTIGPIDVTNTSTTGIGQYLVVNVQTNPDTIFGSIRAVRRY